MSEDEDLGVKIGLEIHVPLKTRQKLFCYCPTDYYKIEEPNVNTCPVCVGMPGSKPFPLNQKALESGLIIARLLDCEIQEDQVFVKRKHYDYPDLPSGYQRTSEPLGVNGELEGVGIWELHIEEDPGRYDLTTGKVDYNRSGVSLVEVVTAPDMGSAKEARDFLREFMNLLHYTNRIIDVGGVLRADVNISLKGGAKVEIKNINSVKGAYKAIQYEIIRQKNKMKRGGKIKQETRGYSEKSMVTTSMRTKEAAEDYRYIPDPDIPPLVLEKKYLQDLEEKLPETPQTQRKRFVSEYGIPMKHARILTKGRDLSAFFEEISKEVDPDLAADWITREVMAQLNYRGIKLKESNLSTKMLIELLTAIQEDEITTESAKKILERVIDSGESPRRVIEQEGLSKLDSKDELEDLVEKVIEENPQAVEDYQNGKNEALNFLMGQVMRQLQYAADSSVVINLLRDKL